MVVVIRIVIDLLGREGLIKLRAVNIACRQHMPCAVRRHLRACHAHITANRDDIPFDKPLLCLVVIHCMCARNLYIALLH